MRYRATITLTFEAEPDLVGAGLRCELEGLEFDDDTSYDDCRTLDQRIEVEEWPTAEQVMADLDTLVTASPEVKERIRKALIANGVG